jgi:hypothetical protein
LHFVFGRDYSGAGRNRRIPPEAAKIMARMVRMPPKPHEEMKVGRQSKKKITSRADSGDKGHKRTREPNKG